MSKTRRLSELKSREKHYETKVKRSQRKHETCNYESDEPKISSNSNHSYLKFIFPVQGKEAKKFTHHQKNELENLYFISKQRIQFE